MKKRNLFLCALLLCAVLLSALAGCDAHAHTFRQTVIQPTCNSIGYTVNTCVCGETYYSDYLPETEHTFNDWIADREATLISGGEEYRTCASCGILQRRDVENLSALPELYLDEASDGKETVSLHDAAGGTALSCEALVTQRADPDGGKHVYELQLIADGDTRQAYFADIGWGEQDRYLLSPQTLDPTYTRTSAAQALWNACLERHIGAETPEWEADALETYTRNNHSTVVQLYRNGSYVGLYLLSLPQDACVGAKSSAGAVLRAEDESNGCRFRDDPVYAEDGSSEGFSFIACADADVAWAMDTFTAFSEVIRLSRDAMFREQLSQYTDPEVLLDYYLLMQFFGAPYGDTVGTVWYTTDLDHWLPTFDSYQVSFGLSANGALMDASEGIPTPDGEGNVSYTGQNLLWNRLIRLFPEALSERYHALRQTILQPNVLFDAFLAQYGQIEPGLFEEEATLSPSVDGAGDTERIRAFLLARLNAMDEWIRAMEPSPEET